MTVNLFHSQFILFCYVFVNRIISLPDRIKGELQPIDLQIFTQQSGIFFFMSLTFRHP